MRLRLVVESGTLNGQQTILEQGIVTLGRAPDCGLRFSPAGDPGVSGHHATIAYHPDGFYIADQQSTNGTFVNGQRVESTWLSTGDVIRLGATGPQVRVWIEEAQPDQPGRQQQQSQYQPQPAYQPQPEYELPHQVYAPAGTGLRHTLTSISHYNPQRERGGKNLIGIGAAIFLAVIMSLIVLALLMSTIGFQGTFVGALVAFPPAPFYLFIYLWMDRYDPEPGWALSLGFAWGALFAVIVSFVINTLFGGVASMLVGEQAGGTLAGVISAPIIEEGTKGAGVVMIMLLLRREFDGVLDGIVYAGVIALGFATVENVLYYGKAFTQEGSEGLLFTMFLRGALSPFVHALFTSMTGIGCGISRESHKPAVRVLMPIAGYVAAMFLHSLWNFTASMLGGLFFVVYFVVWVPLFVVFIVVICIMANRERKIIKRTLAMEVAGGFLSQAEVDLASSLRQRMKWLMSSFSNRKKFNARRGFLRAITKLAFCYWHVENANQAGNFTISLPQIPKFRKEIDGLRYQI
jgi:RsiW-degrading membrane proteinase PrsW (M82 family)